ncbi:MAG: oligosaccharide flippase family protein [Chlorobium sp.]|nr:oligosaccharide flippase family protein [Chlorobium sp.]
MNNVLINLGNIFLKYKGYLKNSFLYLFSSIFTAMVGIAVNPFMAKNLSPEDYAILGYFNSFSLIILPILNFSLISYYLRNYYRIADERKQIVSDTILIALVVYGFIALVAVCGAFYFYCQWSKISFSYYPYALLTFVPIYLGNFTTLFLAKCRLERAAGRFSAVTIVSALLGTVTAILLVVIYKYGATGRLLATLLASVVTAIYCFSQLFGKLQFDFAVIKDAFRFGWPLSLSAMLWYFLSGVDYVMLEKLNDSHSLGFYNVGMQIAGYFAIFYTAIAQTFEPDIYKAIAEKKKGKLLKIIAGIVTLNSIPNILFIIFAPFIIGLLTYNRYTDASGFAQILALKNITVSLYYSTITIIVGFGFTKAELLVRCVGSLLCVLMFKILIENYGFYGAAWGQVFSFVILTSISVCCLAYLHKR